MSEFVYALNQDGMEVARVESDDGNAAKAEIMHYAMIYCQDGPVTIQVIKGDGIDFVRPTQKETGE